MTVPRKIAAPLKRLATEYPVVTITGPRQAGKTTRHSFPEKPYANLEKPEEREFALGDPVGFLNQFPGGAIIDEIQRAPDLLSKCLLIYGGKKMERRTDIAVHNLWSLQHLFAELDEM